MVFHWIVDRSQGCSSGGESCVKRNEDLRRGGGSEALSERLAPIFVDKDGERGRWETGREYEEECTEVGSLLKEFGTSEAGAFHSPSSSLANERGGGDRVERVSIRTKPPVNEHPPLSGRVGE
ncbi:hypothetical protein M407DRAFT_4102 [Tulasnella calospora MUT 4182]|uniref:Uncharacterized protein n=1 Tax=Tulasnella calospora MUT 4182 TaxID=1051891 RepID=A0A0C3MI95_9AGAM|nr:hypothetical protein M407DRAFT_4102 [Tulasnella calospora MUT 4182]